MENAEKSPELMAQSHDGFFKAVFSQPEHATSFFRSHLPAEIAAKISWPSLKVIPGSFVKTSLQQVHSDLLFSVQMDERELLLYLLFEHQSTPDPFMRLRLLGYILEILNKHQKSHGLPLPPVLPFVFHQGPEKWKYSTAFESLFGLPDDLAETLRPFLPKFSHALLDLSQFDPAKSRGETQVRAVLQLMKLSREKELMRFFDWLVRFPAKDFPKSLLELILLYALHSDSDLDVETIYHSLSTNPELESKTMSVAEKLRAQGHVEGHVEGLEEGREEGVVIGKIQAYEEFLDRPVTPRITLEKLRLLELQSMHKRLQQEYESFKRR